MYQPGTPERVEELRNALVKVKARIEAATLAAGRTSAPQLIVVTKFHPAADVLALAGLGVTEVGENREQEAGPKAAEVSAAGTNLTWHFIGQLQSKKAAKVLRFSREIHSVDRASLVTALEGAATRSEQATQTQVRVGAYLQVDLRQEVTRSEDPNAARGGVAPSGLMQLAQTVAASPHLDLRGVMAVAPLGEDPRVAFERLAQLSETLTKEHPEATGISAGMSHDLEEAVAIGATRLRIGTEVLGPRPSVL